MSILVSFHLRQTENGILALAAVVMGLLAIVTAAVDLTKLRRRVLLKAGRVDGVQLLVLPAVGHDLVGVGAIVVTLETVEVTA
jgi:hypothetical protein